MARAVKPSDPLRDRLIAGLRARGLRVTSQRVVILDALAGAGRHATAEETLEVASARLPALSLPTVYAALELFAELGLVRRITAGGAVRYEPVADGHAHFACRRCGAVADVPVATDIALAESAAEQGGARVESAEVVLRGLCPACATGPAA